MSAGVIIATLMREHGETGVQTHFNAFREYLASAGVPVELVTPFAASRALVYPLFGVRRILDCVHKTASVWWYRYWHYLVLREVLRKRLRQGAGTVYAQCPLSARAALEARASPAQRVALVTHFNVSQAHEFALKGQIREGGRYYQSIRRMERRVLLQVDRLVYVSEFMGSVLEKEIPGIGAVASAVIPNFLARPPAAERLPGEQRDLISIGTLEPRKNQQFLLRVLAEAARRGHRYTLTLVGDGPDRTALERQAAESGMATQVIFAGFRPDATSLLAGHRAYVHSAVMENLPLTLIEAMARSLPLLAAPVGGIPEVFEDGAEGFYWPLNDVGAAATQMIRLLDNGAMYSVMAAAAQRRFSEHFEAKAVGRRLLEFILESERASP